MRKKVAVAKAKAGPASLVEIVPGTLYALGGSVPASMPLPWVARGREGWMPFQCYAFRSAGQVLLIDGGLAEHRDGIAAGLRFLLGARDRLSMMITRRDTDAIINIPWLLRRFAFDVIRFPNADFTPLDFFTAFDKANAEAQVHSVVSPAPVEWTPPGKRTEIGGLALDYVRTSLKVLSTNWIYEASTRTLFSSDSFGVLTRPDAGGPSVVSPGEEAYATSDLVDAFNTKLDWLCGAETGPIVAELAAIARDHAIDRVCPSFGCVIEGSEAVDLLFARGAEALDILGSRPKPSVLAGFDWSRLPEGTLA